MTGVVEQSARDFDVTIHRKNAPSPTLFGKIPGGIFEPSGTQSNPEN